MAFWYICRCCHCQICAKFCQFRIVHQICSRVYHLCTRLYVTQHLSAWMKQNNVERTLRIIGNIALMAADWIRNGEVKHETIFGIGVINEPAGQFDQIWQLLLEEFYPRAYNTVRLIDPEGHIAVIIDSAFRSSDHFIDYMPDHKNVMLDIHHYQGFGAYWNNLALDIPHGWNTHFKHTCKVRNTATCCLRLL